jgi:hypothetical protein
MKLLIHALIVSATLFGSDWVLNGGAESRELWQKMGLRTIWAQAKMQTYQVTAGMKQGAVVSRPQIASVASFD